VKRTSSNPITGWKAVLLAPTVNAVAKYLLAITLEDRLVAALLGGWRFFSHI